MLPIVDKPVIQYVVEEAVAAGLSQIILVTAANKRALEDHFDRELELERILEAKGDHRRLHEVRRLADLVDIASVRQKERRGIGHALLMARPLIGDEPFALFFPDDIIFTDAPAIGQLIQVYEKHNASVLAVERLPPAEIIHYGVIVPRQLEERVYEVLDIIEKPRVEEAPSDLAVTGRYVLTPMVFDALADTPVGKGGEIQLTDCLALMLKRNQRIVAYQYVGERFDTGRPIGLLKASVAEGLRRSDIGPELREFLQSLSI